jgi:hypothetical protein
MAMCDKAFTYSFNDCREENVADKLRYYLGSEHGLIAIVEQGRLVAHKVALRSLEEVLNHAHNPFGGATLPRGLRLHAPRS